MKTGEPGGSWSGKVRLEKMHQVHLLNQGCMCSRWLLVLLTRHGLDVLFIAFQIKFLDSGVVAET